MLRYSLLSGATDIRPTGDWYQSLPFGDAKRLKEVQKYQDEEIQRAIDRAASSGTEDLELEDAALKAANVIGTPSLSSVKHTDCVSSKRSLRRLTDSRP